MKLASLKYCVFFTFFAVKLSAQSNLTSITNWSGKENWKEVAEVQVPPLGNGIFKVIPGNGVLVNMLKEGLKSNLVSNFMHGNAKISFDFMMPPGSNSGFYLQGRYEIQLLDSWGVQNATSGHCGGIYKRRRFETKADGSKVGVTYEGKAPRINACLAPGIWQHIDIVFIAPKFNASGQKIANARFFSVDLNGQRIHDNVEVSGQTGGPLEENEVAQGPIMIQGDHGAVAFRNIMVQNLEGQAPIMGPIAYKHFLGDFKNDKKYPSGKPIKQGFLEKYDWQVSAQPDGFANVYTSKLTIPESGKHTFRIQVSSRIVVNLDGKEVVPSSWYRGNTAFEFSENLTQGDHTLEIINFKNDGWIKPILAVEIAGPNTLFNSYHAIGSVLAASPNNPILKDAEKNTFIRSFSDLYHSGTFVKRITHAINVGSPEGLHYTYDLQNACLAQIWKGNFLDMSPMWDDRGDGSSRPRGAQLFLAESNPFLLNGASAQLKQLGYKIDPDNRPIFKYQLPNGMQFSDQLQVQDKKYFTRTIVLDSNTEGVLFNLAKSSKIVQITEELYQVNDAYFIAASQAEIIQKADHTLLQSKLSKQLTYSIFW
jgi:hypothetical protein